MIATPHLQNYQGFPKRGLDLNSLQCNDTIYQEAQSYFSNREGPSCHLGRFPDHQGAYSLGLEVHDQPVCLAPQLALLDEHGEMAQRVDNDSSWLDVSEGFVE